MKKLLAVILSLTMLLSLVPFAAFATDTTTTDYILGDVNGDGRIKSIDYLLLKRALLGSYTPPESSALAADTDQDGELTGFDYFLLKRYILGSAEPPAGSWSDDTSAKYDISISTDATVENVTVYLSVYNIAEAFALDYVDFDFYYDSSLLTLSNTVDYKQISNGITLVDGITDEWEDLITLESDGHISVVAGTDGSDGVSHS